MKGKLSDLKNIPQISNTPHPGLPLVEILGNKRVLIENHFGVIAYGKTRICVKVRCGHIEINGNDLILARMSDSQLIVNGLVLGVTLCYGGR